MQLFSKLQRQISLCVSISVLFIFLTALGASARVTQVTSTEGITVQFTLSDLAVSEVTRDNVRYHEVRYTDSHFTSEPGDPKVPVTRFLLGIPATADIEGIDVSAAPYETRSGIRLAPVPIYDVYRLEETPQQKHAQHAGITALGREWKCVQVKCRRCLLSGAAACSRRNRRLYSESARHRFSTIPGAVFPENAAVTPIFTFHCEHPFFL